MHKLSRPSPTTFLLGALCIAVVAVAYASVGSAAESSGATRRTVTVERGVVQSTVSGTGTVSSSSELDVGFSTAGVVTHIYVREGQHVEKGELLATLDPAGAEIALEQARATLLTAESNLAKEVETDGETSTSSTGGTGSSQTGSTASAASVKDADEIALPASSGARAVVSASSSEASTTPAAATTPATTTAPAATSTPTETSTKTTTTPSSSTTSKSTKTTTSAGTSTSSSSSSTSSATMSAAQREANLVFAKSAVRTDTLAVKSAETALQNTKLDAPQEGTIITLSGTVGETVTATGTTKVSTATTTSSSTTGSASGQAGGSSSTAGASGSSSTSSAFAVISNLRSMQVVVPLSESEIANVHTGQPATVSIEALDGKKLAAEVTGVAATSTSSSGVVTYDVTFHLNQLAAGLKAGMSASAEVVIKQAEGLNVLTSAISGGSVTVARGGKDVTQAVTTGLAGNTSTIILSGLAAGETVVLPSTKATTTSSGSGSAKGSSSGGSLGSSALGGSSGGGAEGPPSGGGGPPGGGAP